MEAAITDLQDRVTSAEEASQRLSSERADMDARCAALASEIAAGEKQPLGSLRPEADLLLDSCFTGQQLQLHKSVLQCAVSRMREATSGHAPRSGAQDRLQRTCLRVWVAYERAVVWSKWRRWVSARVQRRERVANESALGNAEAKYQELVRRTTGAPPPPPPPPPPPVSAVVPDSCGGAEVVREGQLMVRDLRVLFDHLKSCFPMKKLSVDSIAADVAAKGLSDAITHQRVCRRTFACLSAVLAANASIMKLRRRLLLCATAHRLKLRRAMRELKKPQIPPIVREFYARFEEQQNATCRKIEEMRAKLSQRARQIFVQADASFEDAPVLMFAEVRQVERFLDRERQISRGKASGKLRDAVHSLCVRSRLLRASQPPPPPPAALKRPRRDAAPSDGRLGPLAPRVATLAPTNCFRLLSIAGASVVLAVAQALETRAIVAPPPPTAVEEAVAAAARGLDSHPPRVQCPVIPQQRAATPAKQVTRPVLQAERGVRDPPSLPPSLPAAFGAHYETSSAARFLPEAWMRVPKPGSRAGSRGGALPAPHEGNASRPPTRGAVIGVPPGNAVAAAAAAAAERLVSDLRRYDRPQQQQQREWSPVKNAVGGGGVTAKTAARAKWKASTAAAAHAADAEARPCRAGSVRDGLGSRAGKRPASRPGGRQRQNTKSTTPVADAEEVVAAGGTLWKCCDASLYSRWD
eukprot:TRINITY_DN4178_c1_g1_i2.p1 TRINITY_DN4178_c1_g1~~TRINITY_DN4178_c1_g1_i2.p1  ORF type:complete len:696 (+),score=117.82 TRINITY_DN4178_c1_g1_i2:297-2384(+)